jgi:hypothetical protein
MVKYPTHTCHSRCFRWRTGASYPVARAGRARARAAVGADAWRLDQGVEGGTGWKLLGKTLGKARSMIFLWWFYDIFWTFMVLLWYVYRGFWWFYDIFWTCLVIVWYLFRYFWWLYDIFIEIFGDCVIFYGHFCCDLMACAGNLMPGKSIATKLLQCSVNSGLTPQAQQGQEHQHVDSPALNNGHRSHGIRGLHRGWRWVSRLLIRSYGFPYGFTYECSSTRRQDEVARSWCSNKHH